MNGLAECSSCHLESYHRLSCNGQPISGDINTCPFCGSNRICPQIGGFAKCGHRYTEYACGTKIVVSYICGTFIAVGEVSNLCNNLRHDIVEDVI